MVKKILFTAVLVTSPVTASADWIEDTLWEKCSPESRQILAEQTRANIEAHVRRAEAAIVPPTPVGDLSCITDLMSEPLDFFSGASGLFTSFGQLFNEFGTRGFQSIAVDGVQQMICDFAADKWQEVTGSLNGFNFTELTGISLDPLSDAGGGLIPNFSGSFSNLPGSSGGSSSQANYSGPPSSSLPIDGSGSGRNYDLTAQDEAEIAAIAAQERRDLELLVREEAWGVNGADERRMRRIAYEESLRALRGSDFDREIRNSINAAFRRYYR